MTQEKLLQSNKKTRLWMLTAKLGMPKDDKAKMREKETNRKKEIEEWNVF